MPRERRSAWIRPPLNRYDGYTSRVYRHDPFDPTSLSDNSVTALFEDREGKRGWVRRGAASIASTWDREVFQRCRRFLWVATARGLYHYEIATGNVRHYRLDPGDPDGLPEQQVHDVYLDPSGRLWVVTEGWLAELVDPGSGRFRSYRYSERAGTGRWTFPSLSRAWPTSRTGSRTISECGPRRTG